ncbi:unnamed protein product [Lupinus luteus]|uniref:Glucosamine/galactosamine-6-phosphate isomerase domain-containing protein n=1 Tax=Lupinus luteus TaxID=3873 RepID=A0AAV1VVR4_LUPLU
MVILDGGWPSGSGVGASVDSNYKLAYDGFISKVPIPHHQVNTIDDALPADGVADVYETSLRRLVERKVVTTSSETGFPKFDLMLLDMGPDDSVAALFPGYPEVNEARKWVNAPKTFSLPVLNSASNIAMVVTGAGKRSFCFT